MKFPESARRAVAFLYRPYNDIDVFVEDSASRNMYELLIERMLGGKARVTRVIQLGGRGRVLEQCAIDQLPADRRRLYIIDGDLDLLMGRDVPALKYLHRLSLYSSENLVFSESAAIELAYECMSNTPREEVSDILDFPAFVAQLVDPLVSLFASFAVIHEICPHLQTVGLNVMQVCSHYGTGPRLDTEKLTTVIQNLIDQCTEVVSREIIETRISALELELRGRGSHALRFVSGKTYLMPLLYHHLKQTVGYSGTIEQLKVRLARFAEVDMDPKLLEAVIACARG
jgi:hypothetical protein